MRKKQKERISLLILFFILLYIGTKECKYKQEDCLFIIQPKDTIWTEVISDFVDEYMSAVVSKSVLSNGDIELELNFEDLI